MIFTEDERRTLVEESDVALTKPFQRLRKRFKHLKQEVKDMENLLRKNSDGVWDPLEGAVLDAGDAIQGMVNIIKNVNQYRDGRGGVGAGKK